MVRDRINGIEPNIRGRIVRLNGSVLLEEAMRRDFLNPNDEIRNFLNDLNDVPFPQLDLVRRAPLNNHDHPMLRTNDIDHEWDLGDVRDAVGIVTGEDSESEGKERRRHVLGRPPTRHHPRLGVNCKVGEGKGVLRLQLVTDLTVLTAVTVQSLDLERNGN